MSYEVEIKEQSESRVVVLPYEADAQDAFIQVESALSTVWAFLEEHGSAPAGPPFSVRSYIEIDTPLPSPEPWALESGFPVDEALAAAAPIKVREFPATEAACLLYRGGYRDLSEAYLFLQAWIEASGRTPAGPPRELYHTDPIAELDVKNWRTEIQWPLKS